MRLKEEIKKRIEMIERGEVPEGYKKTKVGIIPEDWRVYNFSELAEIQSGLVDPKVEPYSKMFHIGPENIERDTGKIVNVITAEEQKLISGKYVFDDKSIIYSKVRPKLNKVCIPSYSGICSADCYAIRVKKYVLRKYLGICMLSDFFVRQATECSMRTKMPKINQKELNHFKIIVPKIDEQKKIIQISSIMDEARENLENLLIQKEEQKKWLIQNICTKRIKTKYYKEKWTKVRLGDCIKELNEKTTRNNQYEILSVTKRGIVKQSEQFNKQIASQNNIGYKIVKRENLVFSTMNLWMGSLDVLKKFDVGIVSPAYKVFRFNKAYMIPEFGEYFMKTPYMIWLYNTNSEQGASVVRKNLDLNALLNTKVSIPTLPEQQAIAKILTQADKEIQLLQQKLDLMKQEKKAIMQLLLTGIVRVK